MIKFRLQISVLVFLLPYLSSTAQTIYPLYISGADKDSAFIVSVTSIRTNFDSRSACIQYVNQLPSILQAKGYVTASVDSVSFDSTAARLTLFLGNVYRWAKLDAGSIDPSLLEAVGWRDRNFTGRPMDFVQVQQWQEKLLDQLENTGYPFARIFLDSLQIDHDSVFALLKAEKGPLYKIDSIRIFGNARISKEYLQRYLEIPDGSIYQKQKLLQISKKISELAYVEEEQPATLTRLGTGSVLNLYLKQKRSSQINVLVGFLPNNDQLSSKKLLITGEANILLRNALGSGETIGLNWQQIQVKSPRLNILFNYPYIFRSPVGVDFGFDIFRKDSSFVNINLRLGAQYNLNANQAGKIFVQRLQTYISSGGINAQQVIQNRRLPEIGDVSSINLGIDYEFNNTNYRFNPIRGNEIRIITSTGTKRIKKNNEILELKDPGDPGFDFDRLYDTIKLKTYQFRMQATAAHYFPFAKRRSTIKTMLNAGIFESGNVFRNELFQIGGYKLLRGFDEESQYLSHYVIGTAEYRYLVGQNSFFYVLLDGGWGADNSKKPGFNYTYIGTGLGLAFETKAGLFNLAWAVGKRNDTEFNLRQSKIHFGFINYF